MSTTTTTTAEEGAITVNAVSIDKPSVSVTGQLSDTIQSYIDKFVAAYGMQDDVRAGKIEIKLLYQGKILDPSATAKDSNFIDKCVVHYVVKLISRSEKKRREVRINMSDSGSSSNSNGNGNGRGHRARGLASLADMGYSPEEIEEIRTVYRAERALQHPELPVSEDNDLEGEEEWLNQMVGRSRSRGRRIFYGNDDDDDEEEGGNGGGGSGIRGFSMRATIPQLSPGAEFLLGLSLGFGMGFIMICCLFLGNLSLSMKMGITVGICLNLLLTSYASRATKNS